MFAVSLQRCCFRINATSIGPSQPSNDKRLTLHTPMFCPCFFERSWDGLDRTLVVPLEVDAKKWHSVSANYRAFLKASSGNDENEQGKLEGNYVRILRLEV